MKVYSLGRCTGKTTRMIYASELHNAPIICTTEGTKRYIVNYAEKMNINIPTPICVRELSERRMTGIDSVLIDDATSVLCEMMKLLCSNRTNIIAMTVDSGEDSVK